MGPASVRFCPGPSVPVPYEYSSTNVSLLSARLHVLSATVSPGWLLGRAWHDVNRRKGRREAQVAHRSIPPRGPDHRCARDDAPGPRGLHRSEPVRLLGLGECRYRHQYVGPSEQIAAELRQHQYSAPEQSKVAEM